MEIQDGHSIDYDLLARYFAGEASESDTATVREWIAASEKNAAEFAELQMLWIDTGKLPQAPKAQIDTDAAWNQVKSKMSSEAPVAGLGYPWYKMAAAFVIGFGLTWFLVSQFTGGDDESSTQMASNETPVVFHADKYTVKELPDHSTVELAAGSSITYNEAFDGDTRAVELKGQAFFEVEHNPEQPFIITAGATQVKVVGTSFTVDYDTLSGITSVQVTSGTVIFSAGEESMKLTKDMGASFSPESKTIDTEEASADDAFWRNKFLKFKKEKMSNVVEVLRRHYGVNIVLKNPSISNCKLSVKFQDKEIEEIMEIISSTLQLDLSKEGEDYVLDGESC